MLGMTVAALLLYLFTTQCGRVAIFYYINNENISETYKLMYSYNVFSIADYVAVERHKYKLWDVSYKMLADITEFCLHLGC